MSTRDLVLIALFAALMAVLGAFPPLVVPAIGVPITAQSLGPLLMGGILGARRGGLSMLLFLVLVAIGLPLLSGGRGGLAPFVGPWSGFIYGWVAAAVAIGWLTERFWARLGFVSAFAIAVLGGIGIIYSVGVPWYAAMSGTPLWPAFAASALAFVPGDLLKAGVAAAAIVAVKRAYPLIGAGRAATARR
ncbi:biotin transporter BioY [Aureimonas pseudogalii]|uniref:Biotin transporter n=1 Tax=Aureimonas pseudogalii TaxID=1744844 RepID=A0A7W6MKC7_9HYPH|nr:biotin transporter BioY [Aureimonas pseudogalii]MBB3998905.1 biotin transport system substrate-specific component [Aureimonas pseudogalii]